MEEITGLNLLEVVILLELVNSVSEVVMVEILIPIVVIHSI